MSFKKNDWVANQFGIGKVRHVHEDGLLDIVLYARDGKRIGRDSPAMGGPTTFEPCCDPDNWKRIQEPEFPLMRAAYIEEVVHYLDAPHKEKASRPGL